MLNRLVTKEGYELITTQQAAQMCGVIIRTIHNWIQDGRVEVKYQVGRVWLVDKKEVLAASESYQITKPRSGKPRTLKRPKAESEAQSKDGHEKAA